MALSSTLYSGLFVAFCLSSSLLSHEASAERKYYSVSARDNAGGGGEIGYAEIDRLQDGQLTGRICAYQEEDKESSTEYKLLGIFKITGKELSTTAMVLRFSPNEDAAKSWLKLPESISFKRENRHEQNFGSLMLGNGPGWEPAQDSGASPKVSLTDIPGHLKSQSHDRFAFKRNDRKFNLSRFDTMTPMQALSFVARDKWDEIISPSVVHVVYNPANRQKIATYLGHYGDLASFKGSSIPDCGSPLVEDIVIVPPLLEFYFARKLQLSGLVGSRKGLRELLPFN